MERKIFELLDIIADNNSFQNLFQVLSFFVSSKNPALIARILAYYLHALNLGGKEFTITSKKIIGYINPLVNHF